MDNVDLPGRYAGDKKPIAITERTNIIPVMTRERHPQIHTQFGSGEDQGKEGKVVTDESKLSTTSNATYTAAEDREVDEGGILSKASDFFSDNPFGRILDTGLDQVFDPIFYRILLVFADVRPTIWLLFTLLSWGASFFAKLGKYQKKTKKNY